MTGPVNKPPRGRKILRVLTTAFAAAALVVSGAVVLGTTAEPASAAFIPVDQCNGVLATPGTVTVCRVTVVNNLTDDPLTTNSIVTVTDFTGATTITPSADIVTSVTQCNGVGMDGSTVQCYVDITNNISTNGALAATAATVNQCQANQPDGLGSTSPIDHSCNPFSNTSGATITQCNGTGNGGGLVEVVPDFSHCLASGTVSASLLVTVNQCNGSVNGGGSRVDCRTAMTTNVVDTALLGGPPSGTPTGGTGGTDGSGSSGTPGRITPIVGVPNLTG